MPQTNFVIPAILAFFVVLAIIAMARRSRREPRPILSPLTAEARDRYATRWDQIESRFVEAPKEAIEEADAIVRAVLGECDHPLAGKKLPEGMRKARREASGGGTEGQRKAMLHYRAVIEEVARVLEVRQPMPERRRETA